MSESGIDSDIKTLRPTIPLPNQIGATLTQVGPAVSRVNGLVSIYTKSIPRHYRHLTRPSSPASAFRRPACVIIAYRGGMAQAPKLH